MTKNNFTMCITKLKDSLPLPYGLTLSQKTLEYYFKELMFIPDQTFLKLTTAILHEETQFPLLATFLKKYERFREDDRIRQKEEAKKTEDLGKFLAVKPEDVKECQRNHKCLSCQARYCSEYVAAFKSTIAAILSDGKWIDAIKNLEKFENLNFDFGREIIIDLKQYPEIQGTL